MTAHLQRWWVYQRERFPLVAHAPLVAAFSFSAVAYSSLLRGEAQLPALATWLVAFLTSLAFFMQLRIADEFKDFDEDNRYRPYRPVPRGLITLRELGILGFILALVQLLLAVIYYKPLIIFLGITWLYLALMSHEFFIRKWLKDHPVTYMWSHMLIMPLIDFYATSCDWLVLDGDLPKGLFWFLIISFFNGMVIEIGRKIRSVEDEEEGVETYSKLWGQKKATMIWLTMLVTTALCATAAAQIIDFLAPVVITLFILILTAALICVKFLRQPIAGSGKRIELFSGIWTISMYLSLGAGPLLWKV